MAGAPDTLTLKRHRDMKGREWWIPGRRILLALLCAVLLAALLNVFGQRPHSSTAVTPRGSTSRLVTTSRTRFSSSIPVGPRATPSTVSRRNP